MTQNRRIVLNILATYGRSVFALVCGLFSARWVLDALGQEDYGLFGVVGSLVVFLGFVCGLMGTALGRFYAVSVGAADAATDKDAAIHTCREWFSTAVLIHVVLPLVAFALGWPVGEYALKNGWISIPVEKVGSCLWVFRFSCLSSLVGLMTVPFNAMYTAKQRIAELTVYSFASTFFNLIFVYYMSVHPGVWLARYAAWVAFIGIAPMLIIAVRAYMTFPECRLLPKEMLSLSRLKALTSFASWQTFGCLGVMSRSQGIAILLNRYTEFGPMRNSSMTVANQVASQTDRLTSLMVGAFQPAIANAYGAGDMERMRALAYCACKYGTLLSLLFAIPLALELPEILQLWLGTPPCYAAGFCYCVLASNIIDRLASGQMIAVTASGKIAMYQAFNGSALIMTLPLAWLLVVLGLGVYSVGIAMVVMMAICAFGRVWIARSIVGISARYWISKALIPLIALICACSAVGIVPRIFMKASFFRICVTTVLVETSLLAFSWFILLKREEKDFLLRKIRRKL